MESFGNESLVPTGSLSSGRVNKIDAKLECALQDLFSVVPSLVRPKVPGLASQTHRAIAESVHLRAIVEPKSERGLHRKTVYVRAALLGSPIYLACLVAEGGREISSRRCWLV